jgi:hypothetical protein
MRILAFGAGIGVAAVSFTAAAEPANYYRFEDGSPGAPLTTMIDSGKAMHNGTLLAGAPTYSSDVPVTIIPKTGQPNTLSLSLGYNDAIVVPYTFAFQGSKATLEFWVNPTQTTYEGDLFWCTLNTGDTNRFAIGVGGGGYPFINYRDPNGVLHSVGNSPVAIPGSAWSYLAFVKNDNVYSIYINGPSTNNKTTLVSQVTDTNPNLPNATGWTVNGRIAEQPWPQDQFSGLVDEVRLSYRALRPGAFLVK